MDILEKLAMVQADLKAPKNQVNKFGGYNYRSCEDILEAVKPILVKNELTLILTDDVVQIGDRFYVKATAKLFDAKEPQREPIVVSAMAREEDTKKGMDGSQITGASSSYARKYALNGLFNIDDQKDSDTTNKDKDKKANGELSTYQGTITDEQKAEMKKLGVNFDNMLHNLQLPSIDDLSEQQAQNVIEKKKQFLAKQNEAK